MSREEEFTHEGFVYANNIYMERKCELFEVKDIAHDFVQGAIYADQHPRKGLWDGDRVIAWLKEHIGEYYMTNEFEEYFDSMYEDLAKAMEE